MGGLTPGALHGIGTRAIGQWSTQRAHWCVCVYTGRAL